MPKNLDFFSFVKARDAHKNIDAMGGDFSAFLTRVGLLEESVSTLQTTVNNQSQEISTLQTTVNNQSQEISTLQTTVNNQSQEISTLQTTVDDLKQAYEQHTHRYTYPDATQHTTTTHN
jgi:chromosome segregation ATPase